jgi:phosphatidylglycerophosphate synthase
VNAAVADQISNQISTHVSTQVWDLIPILVPGAVFVLGIPAYVARCLYEGVPRDREMEARGGSALIGLHARHYFVWLVTPLWRLLVATGVRADTVTAGAALLGAGSGLAVACGRFGLGGALTLASGILDVLDGRLARFRGEQSGAGAALDSILDRYVDFALLAGLAWFYRDTWVLAAVLFALLGAFLVPYVRAKGEALRVQVTSGLMARPERVIILGVTIAVSPLVALFSHVVAGPPHPLAALGVVFVAVASNLTAISRFRTLVRAVSGAPRPGRAGAANAPEQRGPAQAFPGGGTPAAGSTVAV